MSPVKQSQKIGRYVIEKKIGQGSMGEVYKALDSRIHRSVAIKTLRLNKLQNIEDRQCAGEQFLKEARVYGKLNHPNIATIYDMGMDNGLPFLVMELILCQDLKQIMLDDTAFKQSKKVKILANLARALHYAHQRGVLHRDIKPANIMVMQNGSPKITDFGIAQVIDLSVTQISTTVDENREVLGTPHYMSPEHIKGKGYDCRSDVFSLGIVAYEWLSGNRPFTGSNMNALMKDIIFSKEKTLADVGATDHELSEIIHKCLEKNPVDRFQNAENFSDALEMYLDNLEKSKVVQNQSAFDKLKIIKHLKEKYFFFSDFTEDELLTIFKLSQLRKYIAGEFIIREGSVGTRMYVITSGQVSIQNEKDGLEIELEKLGVGSCVGEMSLVDKQERSASVMALEPTMAIAINETVLRLSNPEICLKLYRNLACLLSEKLRISDTKYKELLA